MFGKKSPSSATSPRSTPTSSALTKKGSSPSLGSASSPREGSTPTSSAKSVDPYASSAGGSGAGGGGGANTSHKIVNTLASGGSTNMNQDDDVNFGTLINPLKEEIPNVPSEPFIDLRDEFFKREAPIEKKLEEAAWLDAVMLKQSEKQNIRLNNDQKVDKEGWLTKEGRLVRSWKKRWFILSGNSLNYYTARKNKLKGSIKLDNYQVRIAKDRPDGRECLELTTQMTLPIPSSAQVSKSSGGGSDSDDEEEGRTLYFDAESPQDRVAWLVAITCKISFLQYQRKMRLKNLAEDSGVLELYSAFQTLPLLDLSRRLDQEPLHIESVVALKDPVRFSTSLKKLILRNARIGDIAMRELSTALIENTSINVLDLSGCSLTKLGAEHLGKALAKTKNIKELDLSMNALDNEALKFIGEGIAQNTSIQRLNLGSNQIGDEGVKFYVDALLKNKNSPIAALELSNNQISDQGTQEIAKLLAETGCKIASVELGNNKVSNDGAKAIADSLMKNTVLKSLNLENNEIGYNGTKDLAFMVVKNPSVERLVLGGNRLGEQALFLLANTGFVFPEFELVSK